MVMQSSHAPLSADCPSLDTLRLSSQSLCSTTFVSRQLRRPVYATTTRDKETTLWHIDPAGSLSEVAKIVWGDGLTTRRSGPCIVFPPDADARPIKVDDFLTRGKGLFSSGSRTFKFGSMACKWRCGSETQTSDRPPEAGYAAGFWHCRANIPAHHPDSSNPTIARFSSSRYGFSKSELTLFAPAIVPAFVYNNHHSGSYPLDLASTVILSAIALVVQKDEWKEDHSGQTPESLRAQLEQALFESELPSYTPPRGSSRVRERDWVVVDQALPPAPTQPPPPLPERRHQAVQNPNAGSYRSRVVAEDTENVPLLGGRRPSAQNLNTSAYRIRATHEDGSDTPPSPVSPPPRPDARNPNMSAYRPQSAPAVRSTRTISHAPRRSEPVVVIPTPSSRSRSAQHRSRIPQHAQLVSQPSQESLPPPYSFEALPAPPPIASALP